MECITCSVRLKKGNCFAALTVSRYLLEADLLRKLRKPAC